MWAGFAAALFYHGSASALILPALLPPAIAAWLMLRDAPAIRFDAPAILLILFWCVLALSRVSSQSGYFSDLFLAIFALVPVLMIGLAARGRDDARIATLATIAALGAAATAATAQFLLFKISQGQRIHWPLLDPNNLAALMNIGVVAAAAEALAADGRRRRWWLAAYALFMAGLMATQSRDGVVAAAGALILLCALPVRPWAERWRAMAMLMLIAAVLPLAMKGYTALWHGNGLGNFVMPGAQSVSDRLALLQATMAMIKAHPWRGTGLGTFSVVYPGFRLRTDMSDGFFAHDDPLQLWTEAGIFAPLLAAAFIAAVTWQTWRRLPKDSAQARAGAAAGFAALAVVTAQSLVTYEIYLPAILLPLGVLLARWRAELATDEPTREPWRRRHWVLGFSLAVFALWLVRITIGVVAINAAQVAEARQDFTGEHRDADIATIAAPQDFFPAPQYEARWRLFTLMSNGDLPAANKKALYDDGLLAARRARELAPGFAYLELAEAQLFAAAENAGLLPGGVALAQATTSDVLKHDPLCLEARYVLASMYESQGNLHDALNALGEGLNWPHPLGRPTLDLDVAIGKLCDTLGDRSCATAMFSDAANVAQQLRANSPSH